MRILCQLAMLLIYINYIYRLLELERIIPEFRTALRPAIIEKHVHCALWTDCP